MFGLGFGARRRGLRRFVDGGEREVNRPLRMIAVSTAALLTVTLAPAEAIAGRGNPARTDVELPELQKDQPVPGGDSTDTFQLPVAPGTQIEYAPTRITPIDGGTDQIVLGGGTQAQSRTATASQAAAGSEMQQVASLPLWVGASQTPAGQSGAQARTATTANTTSASGTWTVTVPTRAETEAAGIDGVIMKLEPSPDATPVDLKLKYETFEQLYGAGWGSRLRFVQFPECFLTTPAVEGCSDATEFSYENNGTTNEVTATVAAPEEPAAAPEARTGAAAATASSAGGAVVLAAVGGESGESGDYKATSLQPSGKWTAGGSSGGFNWSYPIDVPPTAAGPKPSVSLGYSSQSVDGRTSTTNNQASWVGDGWDYSPGFIERTYRSCADDKTGSNTTKKTGDLCWGSYNAVLSLDGSTTQLVPTWASQAARDNGDAPIKWTPVTDNGTRVEHRTGATNGAKDGEHWVVTTPDGTKYHFGLNRLPGWVNGNPTTNSAWTVPVFGNQANEPCHASTYEASACDRAWRWNLDYVEDTHGNAMALYWTQEKNWYAQAGKTDQPKPYVRGGWLDRIEYGLRSDSVHTKPAPAKVSFTVDERCLRKPDFDCSDEKFTKHSTDGLHWPDVPVDSMCKETGKCMVSGPTFWTRKWLTTITTQVATSPGANTYRPVASFELKHNFLDAQYDTNPPAWLDSLRRTGYAADGQISSLPPVTFHANSVAMPNRQTGPGDNRPPFMRLRVAKIFTETGGGIVVTYSQPDPVCTPGAAKPAPENNTSRCFPVFWAPDGEDDPTKVEWFNKYVVERVSEQDFVGGAPPVDTQYRYPPAGAAWAKDDSEFTEPSERTWGQWRGYAVVQTVIGATDAAQGTVASLNEARYFRGMHGDPLPVGTRSVQVKDSTGVVIADDLPAYQGRTAETISYLADVVNPQLRIREVTVPWQRTTATQTRSGLPDLKAYQSGTASTRKFEVTSSGTRSVETATVVDLVYGLPLQQEERGDVAVAGDEKCTVTEYAHNTAANLIGAVVQVRTTAGLCADAASAAPDRVISGTRTLYDNQGFGVAPVRGDATSVENINGAGTGYLRVSAAQFDIYGRPTRLTDANGAEAETIYTPADNSTPTQVQLVNAMGHRTVEAYETGRGLKISSTDANSRTVRTEYDSLGRLTAVWQASRQGPGVSPNKRYSYAVSATQPTVVTAESLRDNGTYAVAKSFYDGLLRERQTQTDAIGPGRIVADTYHNSSGGVRRSNSLYLAVGKPANQLYIPVSNTEIRTWTESSYDGSARVVRSELWYGGAQSPERVTTTEYQGDHTTVIPPVGGTATRTWNDALGRVTRLDQYTNVGRTEFSTTTYTYDARGDRTSVSDAAGNRWTWKHDARGRITETNDPDKGRSQIEYDNSGQPVSTTDARGATLFTTYDALGRRTTLRSGSATGVKLAEWTYDMPGGLGRAAAATRYDGEGNTYRTAVLGYDADYNTSGTEVTIPAKEGALAGSYATTFKYTPTGKVSETGLPAAGGLPAERIVTRYNEDGLPVSTSGAAWYTSDTVYSPFGEVLRTQSGSAPSRLWTTNTYDEHTGKLRTATTHREAGSHLVGATDYAYDKVDNITSINNRTQDGSGAVVDDRQCFKYDMLQQMTEAWTATDRCVGNPVAGSGGNVGGPDAYWTSYTFDKVGNRTSETVRDAGGVSANNRVRAYSYPATPSGPGNSHRLSSVTEGSAGANPTHAYTYDESGNTKTRTANGATQDLTWDLEGRLNKVVDPGSGTSSYLYDADGGRLIARTAEGTTLYLANTEVTQRPGGAVTADRYYTHAGAPTAVRGSAAGSAVTFLVEDHHGTAGIAVSTAVGMPIQRRKTTPFGQPRGAAPATWPGNRGFVGGANDETGLIHLGAREYDAAVGRFISVDSVMDLGDPQQMHGYAYAHSNPVTNSDPTGLCDNRTPGMYGPPGPEAVDPNCAAIVKATQASKGGSGSGGLTPEHVAVLNQAKIIHIDQYTWNEFNSLYWSASRTVKDWTGGLVDLGGEDDMEKLRLAWIECYRGLIPGVAYMYDIPEEVLAGIAWMEVGGGNDMADTITWGLRRADLPDAVVPGIISGRRPGQTSFGPMSIQIEAAARALGYADPYAEGPVNLTEGQESAIIQTLRDPQMCVVVAGMYLANLKAQTPFAGKTADQMTTDEKKQLTSMYQGGTQYWPSAESQAYSKAIWGHMDKIKKSLQYDGG